MKDFLKLLEGKKNVIFIGEAGCGKSEIALNLSAQLSGQIAGGELAAAGVDLFDLDQTKPLYRSRDLAKQMENLDVKVHYQDQHMDSPQAIGGVGPSMADTSRITILDVGGDDIGARLIGTYQTWTNRPDAIAFYVINPYRPWSGDIYAIDTTLSAILAVSHIKEFHIIVNPNLGHETTHEEWLEGLKLAHEMLDKFTTIEAAVVSKNIAQDVFQGLEGKDKELPFITIEPMIDYGF